jgi:hypothetical protein
LTQTVSAFRLPARIARGFFMPSKPIHITYLGLLESDRANGLGRAEAHLARLAEGVVAGSNGRATVELISCGPQPRSHELSPGVLRTVLPMAGRPATAWDALSWDLPERLANTDLVHLHDNFSRACEVGMLLAKQERRPVCYTEYGARGDWLFVELGLAELADAVICHSPDVARETGLVKSPLVIPCAIDIDWLGVPKNWPSAECRSADQSVPAAEPDMAYDAVGEALYSIYDQLLRGRQPVLKYRSSWCELARTSSDDDGEGSPHASIFSPTATPGIHAARREAA